MYAPDPPNDTDNHSHVRFSYLTDLLLRAMFEPSRDRLTLPQQRS